MATKLMSRIEEMINNNKIFSIMDSIAKIDDMIRKAKTDKTIDVENLRIERRKYAIELKKFSKLKERQEKILNKR